jgi:NagD protein
VVGEGALIHELYKAGFTITDVNPDFVIVGETRSFNWEMMHKAASLSPTARALLPPTRILTVAASTRPAARCAPVLKNLRPQAVLRGKTQPVDYPLCAE